MAKHTKHLSVWDKTFNWFELKPIWIYKFFIPKDQSIILPITNTSFFFIMENYFIWIEAVSDVILHATSMVWNPQLNKKNPPLFRIQNNWDNSNKRCFRCFFLSFPTFYREFRVILTFEFMCRLNFRLYGLKCAYFYFLVRYFNGIEMLELKIGQTCDCEKKEYWH